MNKISLLFFITIFSALPLTGMAYTYNAADYTDVTKELLNTVKGTYYCQPKDEKWVSMDAADGKSADRYTFSDDIIQTYDIHPIRVIMSANQRKETGLNWTRSGRFFIACKTLASRLIEKVLRVNNPDAPLASHPENPTEKGWFTTQKNSGLDKIVDTDLMSVKVLEAKVYGGDDQPIKLLEQEQARLNDFCQSTVDETEILIISKFNSKMIEVGNKICTLK